MENNYIYISKEYYELMKHAQRKYWFIFFLICVLGILVVISKMIGTLNSGNFGLFCYLLGYMVVLFMIIGIREKYKQNYEFTHSVKKFFVSDDMIFFVTNGDEKYQLSLSKSRLLLKKTFLIPKGNSLKYCGINYVFVFNDEELYFPIDGVDDHSLYFKNVKIKRPTKELLKYIKNQKLNNVFPQ